MSILNDYKVICKLGEQKNRKFGSVHLVEELDSGELFVMKTVYRNKVSPSVITRFKQESRYNFSFLGLPSIRLYKEESTALFLLLPYVKGEQIDIYWNRLQRGKRIQFIEKFMKKLEPIFAHLEEQKVVHCDIKPSNIIISEIDDDFEVQLIDFGMAIYRNNEEEQSVLFPLGYAAPELVLNQLNICNQSTDIFSLGILIWRLYAGKLPLTHPNPSIFTNLQITHPLSEDSSLPKGLFPILQKMTLKHQFKIPPNQMENEEVKIALQDAISKRYQTIAAINADLNMLQKRRWVFTK